MGVPPSSGRWKERALTDATVSPFRQHLRPLRTPLLLYLLDELLLRQLRGYHPVFAHPTDSLLLANAISEWQDCAYRANQVLQELAERAEREEVA